MSATDYDAGKFYDGLVKHRLILPTGVAGAFGRGPVFEDVLERFNRIVDQLAIDDHAETVTYPPIINREVLEQVEYLDSFPQLAGVVHSFFGKELKARELAARVKAGEPWGEFFEQTDVALTPAACYPVYPTLRGTLPVGGRTVSLTSWVFRHEPSPEPTRMQAFRCRELIRVGSTDDVVKWRDTWLQRGLDLLTQLGLPAKSDVASDPFFGRGGRMMAVNQIDLKLKFEVLVPVISTEHPTAVCSFNFHQDKFASKYDIKTSDGETANTACLGFGLERCVMALFQTHGFDPGLWPREVRTRLWP
ncbi:MAG: amino acid--[acyl-carrier-protein] ligase [Kofleriaceae bacterium]|nr:amino acid--[acyl-carrier-protein] ligase [Kofleriaceae bacterium]